MTIAIIVLAIVGATIGCIGDIKSDTPLMCIGVFVTMISLALALISRM